MATAYTLMIRTSHGDEELLSQVLRPPLSSTETPSPLVDATVRLQVH